jgi:hypothetical protein
MGEGAEEPLDETAYATRIEEAFIAERGTPFLLSARDWQLIRGWRESGIPADTVVRAIRETFEKRRAREVAGKISSVAYCAGAVEERWQLEQRGLIGQGEGRRDEKPGEIAPRLRNLVDALRLAEDAAPAEIDREVLRKAVGKAVAGIEALAPDGGFDDIEETLSAIEAAMIRTLRRAISPEVSAAVEAGVAESLGETAGIRTEVVERMRRALARREVRRRLGLPALTLF